jgi:hypothetical protein
MSFCLLLLASALTSAGLSLRHVIHMTIQDAVESLRLPVIYLLAAPDIQYYPWPSPVKAAPSVRYYPWPSPVKVAQEKQLCPGPSPVQAAQDVQSNPGSSPVKTAQDVKLYPGPSPIEAAPDVPLYPVAASSKAAPNILLYPGLYPACAPAKVAPAPSPAEAAPSLVFDYSLKPQGFIYKQPSTGSWKDKTRLDGLDAYSHEGWKSMRCIHFILPNMTEKG